MTVPNPSNFRCPQCDVPLSLRVTFLNEGPTRDTVDVGHCPLCHRDLQRSRATNTYRAVPREPRCPECGLAINYSSQASSSTHPFVYACHLHPHHAWRLDAEGEDEHWVKL